MPSLGKKLALRAYLATMRIESMWALSLRRRLIGILCGHRPANLNVFAHVYVEGFEGLSLGRDVSINRSSNLSCDGGVTLGDNVAIGHGTSIISTNHGFSDATVPIKYQPMSKSAVRIGDNVWIGAKVTVLPGVSIASGCVIAAGAVVTRSIEQTDMIVAGVPARPIRSRLG